MGEVGGLGEDAGGGAQGVLAGEAGVGEEVDGAARLCGAVDFVAGLEGCYGGAYCYYYAGLDVARICFNSRGLFFFFLGQEKDSVSDHDAENLHLQSLSS